MTTLAPIDTVPHTVCTQLAGGRFVLAVADGASVAQLVAVEIHRSTVFELCPVDLRALAAVLLEAAARIETPPDTGDPE